VRGVAATLVALGALALSCSENSPDAPESCERSVDTLEFGSVLVGAVLDKTFVIRNTGSTTISGAVTLEKQACVFSIVIGGGAYELAPAQSRTVVVRFEPIAAGPASCTIGVGAGCDPVTCTGMGDTPAICLVTPDTLDFGVVALGDTAASSFTIRNNGGSSVSGTVTLPDCPEFSLAGDVAYALGAGAMREFGVRFAPTALGEFTCRVETGSDSCPDVFARGIGGPPPECEVAPDAIDFGLVAVGEFGEETLVITNTGGGTLRGTIAVPESCGAFTIAGGATYELGADESAQFTIRFAPKSEGERACALDLGSALCPDLPLAALGGPAALCVVTAESLDFGTVVLGTSADRTFSIRNDGGGTLSGTIAEACPDFAIVGTATYSIGVGASVTFTLRFTPASAGAQGCELALGDGDCKPLVWSGTGEPAPACSIDATALDFGIVALGESADRTLTIRNRGGGLLAGTAALAGCPDFAILGDPAYALAAGASHALVVRFTPSSEGAKMCAIETGSPLCVDASAAGFGFLAPECVVTPGELDFGVVGVNQTVNRTLTIQNAGGDTLAGTVAAPCPSFSVVGDAAYSLTAGQSKVVTIAFAPTAEGEASCSIETGSALCDDVAAMGTGTLMSACSLSTASLDFGTVTAGESADLTFSITNTGGGLLAGTVSEGCAEFSIQGTAAYSLAAGGSQTFTVRFAPAGEGDATCTIETGAPACPDLSASGTGFLAPLCVVSPESLDFGTVALGESADRTFTIRNAGGGLVEGILDESCPDFAIIGSASFSVSAGDSHVFTVNFFPLAEGPAACTIATGDAGCVSVLAAGAGEAAPVCAIDPPSLSFGSVTVGASDSLAFTITNTGGGTLAGTASAPGCTGFSIVGGASYSLGNSESDTITVRFAPQAAGAQSCAIDLGSAPCADVDADGTGLAAPMCSLSVASLDFGTVTVGACLDKIFTIRNSGTVTLTGNVSLSCPEHYTIELGGGAFSLNPNQTRQVRVNFAPTTAGSHPCSVELGTNCAAVPITGTGGAAPACQLSVTSLNFGSVNVNSSTTRTFNVTNAGGGTMAVNLSESCADYTILSATSFDLAGGASQTVTVRFLPLSSGTKNCNVSVFGQVDDPCEGSGPDLCADVSCTGVGVGLSCATDVIGLITATCISGGCHPDNADIDDCVSLRNPANGFLNLANPALSLLLLNASGTDPGGHDGFGGPVSPAWDNSPPGSSYSTVLQWITQGAAP
jgi:hypothetical protein